MDPKNLVRGALAYNRMSSRPDASSDLWQRDFYVHQQLNKALVLARRAYNPRQFFEFKRWLDRLLALQAPHFRKLGTGLTSLGVVPKEIEAQRLEVELQLAVEQLTNNKSRLEDFVRDAAKIYTAISTRDFAEASKALAVTVKREGYSYWSIETELALTQLQSGVEPLKARIAELAVEAPAWNRFFFYMFGLRNEPAQASSRFKAIVRKKLDDSSMSESLKPYARFRLFGLLELEEIHLASILSCEGMSTLIDLLFTIARVVRLIADNSHAFADATSEAARLAWAEVSPLLELIAAGKDDFSSPRESLLETGASQLLENAKASIEKALEATSDKKRDHLQELTIDGVASLLSTRSDGQKAEELIKASLNLSWLPDFVMAGDIADVPALPRLVAAEDTSGELPIFSIKSALREVVCGDHSETLKQVFAALSALRLGDPTPVKNALAVQAQSQSFCPSALDLFSVRLAQQQLENGDLDEFLQTCARAGMENDRLINLLPLGDIFQGVKWSRLKPLSKSLNLSICLNLYLRSVDDRKIRTYKRYAVEELAKTLNLHTVTSIPTTLVRAGEAVGDVEYFGYNVCDIATLELLPGMGDSRRVLRTRSDLLRELAKLHSTMELNYRLEANEIDQGLQVNDGLTVLEDSKVYVDEQAILNHVNLELEADFQRYKKLVESGVGVSESIEDLLESFNSPTAKTFRIPKNDADDLLAELVGSILQRFLFDPASGLDIIIGRRIRHGTIAGELRGALEGAELIGQRSRPGAAYDPSSFVEKSLQRLDGKRRKIGIAAFSRFSESIDQLVSLLRDEYFHVSSKSKTKGIFYVNVTPVMLALARSLAQTCTSIQEFSKECVQIFWYLLSVRLDALRPKIEGETKKTLQSIFAKLAEEVRALGLDNSLSIRVQQASEELQHRASTIATWIRVPKSSTESAQYPMSQVVDVAAAVVCGQRPGFRPKVTSDVPPNYELNAHGFSLVADALYIAIDNVGQHSGKKVDNQIKIQIQAKPDDGLLSFDIVSEVSPSARTAEKEARLSKIRGEIQKKRYAENARRDRNSGLSKLAAVVMQSEKTSSSLVFGFEGDNLFSLKFDLVLITIRESSNSKTDNLSTLPSLELTGES
ncbi:hypothetical protein [Paraburkholderia sp. J67]|uniref:hypothetical protein n=1 Tax=Paraburkholderia sp. J67 TaxID=2805435 RepID=UPI002ABE6D54|nr:hypothetical protein [Paraburkholderia sp. J67]